VKKKQIDSMKVFIHYEEPAAASLRQTLKITLPKSWQDGLVRRMLECFVANYNEKHPENELKVDDLRLETDMRETLSLQATVRDCVGDRADLYVKFGARAGGSFGSGAVAPTTSGGLAETGVDEQHRVRQCKNFGCQKKFTLATNFEGECRHHVKPPVFHETAKYWSCCPHKKAYDWEDFMKIEGCAVSRHTDLKPTGDQFLGGNELRGSTTNGNAKLKTVDDFNRESSQAAAKTAETPLDLLKRALVAVGCSATDFDKALKVQQDKFPDQPDEVLAEFATEFGFGLHSLIGTTAGGLPPGAPGAPS